MDASFGSRRGAILQQNLQTAHRPKIKVSLTGYQLGVGLDPIHGVHTLAGMWKKNKFPFFFFFGIGFVSKYHKTAGCNFWQPQGGRFTAKFGIGTPPRNESFSDTLPIMHGTRPNRWIAHLCRNVQKEYILIVFVLNSCPNTIKQLDASFGSPRGAVLQQNVLSAHHPKIKVSLTRYQVGVGLDPIDEVHTLAGMWKMNKFAFFWNEFVCKYH